jgi:hypothetical protein
MKSLIILVGISALTPVASAQEVAAWLGLGTAHDGDTHQQVNTFGDGSLYPTKGIGGLFGHFGMDVFFTKQFGAGFDASWRASQGTYTGIGFRPVFYSVDGIYQPIRMTSKKVSAEFRVGIGGAALTFSPDGQQNCVNGPGCQNSHDFQLHLGAAPRVYVTDHLFVRPAFDVHYVNGFTEFGSNWVTEYSVGIGYGLGRR